MADPLDWLVKSLKVKIYYPWNLGGIGLIDNEFKQTI